MAFMFPAYLLATARILILLLFGYSFLAQNSYAFNIDTRRPQIHRRVDSGFGYSVDFAYRSSRKDKFSLIVGAPFAQSSSPRSSLRTPGAVYGCEVDQNICSEIFFDQRQQGNELRLNGSALLPIEEKSYGMFGATVAASKKGDAVLACAPHYKYFFSKFEVVEPVGTCYYARDYFNRIDEFAPCRQEPARHGHHRFGYGMCGFSAAVPGDGDRRLFISAPGVWYWQGATFSQNVENATDRPNTADGPAHTDNQQLGYATAAGDFSGDGVDDVVVGVPRGNDLTGAVYIYSEQLRPVYNITLPANLGQRGQYFGASVAVTDLNRDGRVDLIVGSPFYTDYQSVSQDAPGGGGTSTQERKPQYDVGAVYVYLQTPGGGAFREPPIHLIGHQQWGRFGHAVAAAGDLNGDGLNDFIVGAPYEGDDGNGAIYVYHGAEGEEGVRRKPTQRIQAKDVHRELRTFGFSLRGARDVDGNEYPDVAVGAFASSQAVVLKTKPVMQVTGYVRTTRKTINLDEKLCTTEFGRMPCEKFRLCLKYGGKLQSEYNTADLRVKLHLDSRRGAPGSSPRAFLSRKDLEQKRGARVDPSSASRDQPDKIEHTIQLTRGREHCESYDVYVPDTIRDKLSPIVLSANYTLIEKGGTRGGLEPAIDTTLPQSFEAELLVEKNCGADNVCVPNLQLSVNSSHDKLTVGAPGDRDQKLTLNVTVRNRGEDSYLTQFYITLPPGFEYSGVENYATAKHKVSCSPVGSTTTPAGKKAPSWQQRPSEPYTFVCDIGNPLPAGGRADFGMRLTAARFEPSVDHIELNMHVNSTIAEAHGDEHDNSVVLQLGVEISAQLNLIGRSNPEQLDFSIANRTEGVGATFDFEVGPVVSHLYQVINRGPSAIKSATLDIVWPSYQMNGKNLLYLIDMPFVSDARKATCRVNQGENINPASLAISNQHVPTSAPPGAGSKNTQKSAPRQPSQSGRKAVEVEEYEDEFEYLRKRRDTSSSSDSARLQRLEDELRGAVEQAPEGTGERYSGTLSRKTINCHDLKCTHVQCDIRRLEKDDYVLVELFSRLWVNTLIEEQQFNPNSVSSLAIAQITAMPSLGAAQHLPTPPPLIVAVTTHINPIDDAPKSIGWWWWLIAILVGLLILTLVVWCCYRIGFFKRQRPPMEKAQYQQGMSSGPSGHYADDSARYAQPQLYSPDRHGVRV